MEVTTDDSPVVDATGTEDEADAVFPADQPQSQQSTSDVDDTANPNRKPSKKKRRLAHQGANQLAPQLRDKAKRISSQMCQNTSEPSEVGLPAFGRMDIDPVVSPPVNPRRVEDSDTSMPAITTTEFPPLSVITSHPSVPDCDLQNKKRPLETTDDGSDGESARNSPSTRKQKQCNADVLEETNSTCIDVTTAAEATRPLSAAERVQTVHGGDAVTIVAETEEAHSVAQEVTERNPPQELTDPQTADSVSALELVTEEQGNGTRTKDAVEAASVTTVVKIDNPNDGALNQDVRRRRLKLHPNLKASRNQSKQQPAQEEATAKNVLYEIITERPKEVPSSDISDAKPLVPAITTTEFPPLSVITSHPSVPDCDLQNKKRPLETTDDGSDGESARNSPSTRKQKQCNADVLEETNSTCIDVTTAAEATRPLSAAERVQTVHGGDAVTIVAETEEAHSVAQEVTERNPPQELTDPQTADSVSALELVTEEQGNGTRTKDAVEAASVTTVVKIDNPNDGALNQDVRRRRLKLHPNLKASRNQSKQQPAQEEATAKNVLYEIITERPKEVPSSDISDAKPLAQSPTLSTEQNSTSSETQVRTVTAECRSPQPHHEISDSDERCPPAKSPRKNKKRRIARQGAEEAAASLRGKVQQIMDKVSAKSPEPSRQQALTSAHLRDEDRAITLTEPSRDATGQVSPMCSDDVDHCLKEQRQHHPLAPKNPSTIDWAAEPEVEHMDADATDIPVTSRFPEQPSTAIEPAHDDKLLDPRQANKEEDSDFF
ncbi:uncharacterized protein LOC126352135 [Schistocerca gregaria]|uniref:uncharacterized protein LOC126352135 n=1 Tax=Schistocerca gregaria TaxID=7010 RepID=UPI00211F29B5|nr:uncharacterized protein LOC126352135 [Schistocerca gregaria]